MRRIRKSHEFLVSYLSPKTVGRSIIESSILLNTRNGINKAEKYIEQSENLKMVGVTNIQLLRSKRR